VLVLGGAGGVGHLAVQIAKALDAYVLATARAPKHDFLRELGADEAIDYTTAGIAAAAGEVDVVLDLVGDDRSAEVLPALRDGGIFVAVQSTALDELQARAGDRVRVTGILVEPDRAGLESIAQLVETGRLRPHVERTFPLEQAAQAHELGEQGRTQGKIVLRIV
jgi:NADPH:quinone reductase-like Zn-dependent oxidoreductase